ncbi:hypothetical protein U1Q18_006680 [Sarracenia purpurea var. burkii]
MGRESMKDFWEAKRGPSEDRMKVAGSGGGRGGKGGELSSPKVRSPGNFSLSEFLLGCSILPFVSYFDT